MMVHVLLFARLRELAGRQDLDIDVEPGSTVRDAWAATVGVAPRLDGADNGLRVAVNEVYAEWDRPVVEGDSLAFIPPVAGGAVAARVHVRVTAEPLDARTLETLVRRDSDGAVCTFTGVVRDHAEGRTVERLEYEAYPSMAEAEMLRIAEEALRRTEATAIAIEHRTGTLGVGEASVVVCVSAPHRGTAFEACRWAMDTLKAQAPIWKKEFGKGGAVWVDEGRRAH